MSVPVCCMFYVSPKPHMKRSPNGIKTDGAYFWKVWKIRKENQRKAVPEVVTRQPPLRARPYPREPIIRRLTLFFCRKKSNIRKKSMAKVSGQSELRISIYIRNGETEPEEERRNRERQRDRSNLRVALAPPTPWEPRTREETLLPSREKVKEE